MIEYASTRTGDPADIDAAAKQVQLLPCSLLYTRRCVCCDGCGSQAAEQDDPSILDAATARNNAMWPVFIIANLNRLNSYDMDFPVFNVMCSRRCNVECSYTSKIKKKEGNFGFAPTNSRLDMFMVVGGRGVVVAAAVAAAATT
jgi:hypothetical protein